jgi:hypothetical protein
MAEKGIYIKDWEKLIKASIKISRNQMHPLNFYRVVVYRYADPQQTKVLSGMDTAYIFLLGKFANKIYYLPAIKLKHVKPYRFFEALKLVLEPLSAEIIDKSEEFRELVRKMPMHGKPIFETIKKKPMVYDGNYREYKMTSIQSVELLQIDKEYIKSKLLPNYPPKAKSFEEKESNKNSINKKGPEFDDRTKKSGVNDDVSFKR